MMPRMLRCLGSPRTRTDAGDDDLNDGDQDIQPTGTAPADPVALLLHDVHCNPQFPQVARNQRLRATIADDNRKKQRNRLLFADFASPTLYPHRIGLAGAGRVEGWVSEIGRSRVFSSLRPCFVHRTISVAKTGGS
jgi:hypothetical protein